MFTNTKQLNKTKCVDYVDTWQVDNTAVNIYKMVDYNFTVYQLVND